MTEIQGNDPDMEIQHVTFRSDGIIEFIYTELRDVNADACLVKTLVIDGKKLPAQDVDDLFVNLRDLIDEGLLVLRNPDGQAR